MRILFVFNHPAPYKVNFFNELSKKVDLFVIFERNKSRNRNAKFYSVKDYDFTLIPIKGLCLGNENFVSNGIVKELKRCPYDLIVMNGYSTFAEMKAIRYLQKNNIPYCLYINGGIIKSNESKWKKNLKTSYISGASWYFSPDHRSNEYLVYYGANEDKIYNYPYSTIFNKEIATERMSGQNRIDVRDKYGVKTKYMFVTCSQIIKRKNVYGLIREWAKEPKDRTLIIIGTGDDEHRCQVLIKQLHLDNVKIVGFLSKNEIFECFRSADAFVFASNEDIYGHVINEALSQGLPVVSTPNVNSVQKLIVNGENGFIVNQIDSEEFHTAIDKVLKLDAYDSCIATAKENTIESMANSHFEIFKGGLKG